MGVANVYFSGKMSPAPKNLSNKNNKQASRKDKDSLNIYNIYKQF